MRVKSKQRRLFNEKLEITAKSFITPIETKKINWTNHSKFFFNLFYKLQKLFDANT